MVDGTRRSGTGGHRGAQAARSEPPDTGRLATRRARPSLPLPRPPVGSDRCVLSVDGSPGMGPGGEPPDLQVASPELSPGMGDNTPYRGEWAARARCSSGSVRLSETELGTGQRAGIPKLRHDLPVRSAHHSAKMRRWHHSPGTRTSSKQSRTAPRPPCAATVSLAGSRSATSTAISRTRQRGTV